MRSAPKIAVALLVIVAAPAAAQNVAQTPATPPASVAPPLPAPVAPAPAPAENVAAPANVTVAAPAPAPAPPPPMEIDPDTAYPNGFADPADPFGNDLSLARREESRFPWGLLGLLGLLGLIPLFRKSKRVSRTVYVDRDDPNRVLREEQVED